MKRRIGSAMIGAAMAVAAGAAEDAFSRTVGPADFVAAGLARLSPEELARLDALVRDYKSGAPGRTRRETAGAPAAAPSPGEAKPGPALAEDRSRGAGNGLLAKAKVMLAPGTRVEYETVKSRIAGEFGGWEARTVFVLENGQRWQVAGGSSYVTPPVPGPAVEIVPGVLGSFWLKIDGVRVRAKVVLVGSAK